MCHRRWTPAPETSLRLRRRWPTGSPRASPPIRPTGTCCSRNGSQTFPTNAAPGWSSPDAHRHGLPLLVRRTRRRAVACVAAGRRDARARPRRQRAGTLVAARRAARLRGVGRQGGPDPVQRVGGPPAVRAGHPPQGQALAVRRRLRRASPPRAERAEPVDAGAEHRRGADRRDLPHVDHEVVDAQRLRADSAAHAREDRGSHRGVGSGAALADGGAGQRRRRDPQRGGRRGVRVGAAAGRLSAAGQVGAVPRPLRRAPQGHGRAARRPAGAGEAVR